MSNIQLFGDPELDSLADAFSKVCKKHGLESIIIAAHPDGSTRISHGNVDLGLIDQEELTILSNKVADKGCRHRHDVSRNDNIQDDSCCNLS